MVFQNNLLMGAASASSGGPAHTVGNSVMLEMADSAYFNRTFGTPTDNEKWTYSTWVKRGKLSDTQCFGLGALVSSSGSKVGYQLFGPSNANTIQMHNEFYAGTGSSGSLTTNAVYIDPHAWMHVVMMYDSANSTENQRSKLYVNGVQISSFSSESYPSQNTQPPINSAIVHYIGRDNTISNSYFSGYLAECVFCDGQAYEASDFGEYDSNKVWRPKDPSGLTFGDNGFYLDFADSSALGNDISGNNNDWTANNLAAGDQSTDTPTNNQCVLTPIYKSSDITLSQGNLKSTGISNNYDLSISSMAIPKSGKWVCEFDVAAADTYPASLNFYVIGVAKMGDNNTTVGTGSGYYLNIGTGEIIKGASVVVDTGGPINGTIRVEYDADNDTIEFFDDGTEVFPAATGASNTVGLGTSFDSLHFSIGSYLRSVARFSNLSGTPTTGFKELSSANLSTPTISDGSKFFQPVLYTGNGSARNIDQTGNSTFTPDDVWIKNRSQADDWKAFDRVQGVQSFWEPNDDADIATDSNSLTSFDSDGFGLGSGAGGFNDNTENFVAYMWSAGGGASQANENGSINTTNQIVSSTSQFSISKFTGTGANATVGHGLSGVDFLILKHTNATNTSTPVWHSSLANSTTGYLLLDKTNAEATSSTAWNSTTPTSSVISLGSSSTFNASSQVYYLYCWNSVVGFSKFGKYYGTGSATIPPLANLGFKPSLVLIKKINSTGNFLVYDNSRSPNNEIDDQLLLTTNAAETTGSEEITFLSTGFAPAATDSDINTSGHTYIYAAWATNPFGGEETTDTTAY